MKLFFELFLTIFEYHYVSNDDSCDDIKVQRNLICHQSLWLIIHKRYNGKLSLSKLLQLFWSQQSL